MEDRVNFGFTKVDIQEKTPLVQGVFSQVASKYDLMNDIMSLGQHHLWKKRLLKYLPNKTKSLIDVAGGTGDIAIGYCQERKEPGQEVILCDLNEEMVDLAYRKIIDVNLVNSIKTLIANAEAMPLEKYRFHYYTIAFGIRNVTNIQAALNEAYRILKPGGKFVCLEFSTPSNEWLQKVYNIYSMEIIPRMGRIFASNEAAYRYLVESIRCFPNQENFAQMIREAGFCRVNYENLCGGITAIHYGYKL